MVICPQCHQDDCVAKISAVYHSEAHHGGEGSGCEGLYPDLKALFRPPLRVSQGSFTYLGVRFPLWLQFALDWQSQLTRVFKQSGLSFAACLLIELIGLRVFHGRNPVLFGGLGVSVVAPVLIFLAGRSAVIERNEPAHTKTEQLDAEFQRRWEQGCFCGRCGVVFSEAGGQTYPLDQYPGYLIGY